MKSKKPGQISKINEKFNVKYKGKKKTSKLFKDKK